MSGAPALSDRAGTDGTASIPARWRALTTHARVLLALDRRPDTRLVELARELGLSERFVTRVIDELERDGYLIRRRCGRRNHYTVRRDLPLPDAQAVLTVADLQAPAVEAAGR